MKQPRRVDKTSKTPPPKPKTVKKRSIKVKKPHPKYGTSKLEDDFAKQFLDKLGVEYCRQFEARDIGRFYDFAILGKRDKEGNLANGGKPLLIEVDGNYFHSDPRLYEEEKLSPMQKKNRRVDEYKNRWALMHGYPLMRIWESDIRKNPKEVMKRLKERLFIMEEENRKKGRNLGKKP